MSASGRDRGSEPSKGRHEEKIRSKDSRSADSSAGLGAGGVPTWGAAHPHPHPITCDPDTQPDVDRGADGYSHSDFNSGANGHPVAHPQPDADRGADGYGDSDSNFGANGHPVAHSDISASPAHPITRWPLDGPAERDGRQP